MPSKNPILIRYRSGLDEAQQETLEALAIQRPYLKHQEIRVAFHQTTGVRLAARFSELFVGETRAEDTASRRSMGLALSGPEMVILRALCKRSAKRTNAQIREEFYAETGQRVHLDLIRKTREKYGHPEPKLKPVPSVAEIAERDERFRQRLEKHRRLEADRTAEIRRAAELERRSLGLPAPDAVDPDEIRRQRLAERAQRERRSVVESRRVAMGA